jgi:hypothetical protein
MASVFVLRQRYQQFVGFGLKRPDGVQEAICLLLII